MAIISTRQNEDEVDSKTIRTLIEILEDATSGTIGNHPKAMIQSGTDIDTLLENVRVLLDVQQAAGRALFNDVMILSHENLVLTVKYEEAMNVLDDLMDVTYDDALEHATLDLMDALIGSGAAEADQDGDLVFDPRVAIGKGDLKPVLREAIIRWVEQKIK